MAYVIRVTHPQRHRIQAGGVLFGFADHRQHDPPGRRFDTLADAEREGVYMRRVFGGEGYTYTVEVAPEDRDPTPPASPPASAATEVPGNPDEDLYVVRIYNDQGPYPLPDGTLAAGYGDNTGAPESFAVAEWNLRRLQRIRTNAEYRLEVADPVEFPSRWILTWHRRHLRRHGFQPQRLVYEDNQRYTAELQYRRLRTDPGITDLALLAEHPHRVRQVPDNYVNEDCPNACASEHPVEGHYLCLEHDEWYVICSLCEGTIEADLWASVGGRVQVSPHGDYLCADCFDAEYERCEACEEPVTYGRLNDGLCRYCAEERESDSDFFGETAARALCSTCDTHNDFFDEITEEFVCQHVADERRSAKVPVVAVTS